MTKTKIKTIMENVDYQGNGKINYTEFLAATIPVESVLTDKKLLALFKHFDTDNSDFITPDNIREAFSQNGRDLSEKETKQIMNNHDMMGDGRLSYDEFKAIFFDTENTEAANSPIKLIRSENSTQKRSVLTTSRDSSAI